LWSYPLGHIGDRADVGQPPLPARRRWLASKAKTVTPALALNDVAVRWGCGGRGVPGWWLAGGGCGQGVECGGGECGCFG